MVILAYFVLLVAAFFFFIVRPQRRNLARHRALVGALEVGDEIVTTSGIHGAIRTLDDETLRLEIAPGVVITLARAAVSQVVRPEPPLAAADGGAEKPEPGTESSD